MADRMNALLVRPGREPEKIQIENELEDLQKAVGGYIEVVEPCEDPVCFVCNEEGKCLGMERNRRLRDEFGNTLDILCGPFLIVGAGGDGDFCSLSGDLSCKYEELFRAPERFPDRAGDDLSL